MLKAKSGWNENGNGTDEFGFSTMPGGSSYYNDDFSNIGERGEWWTATENDADDAHSLRLWDEVNFYEESNKKRGFSVRCLQN
jgi:uncharacterized protein (TIGR02145 family)